MRVVLVFGIAALLASEAAAQAAWSLVVSDGSFADYAQPAVGGEPGLGWRRVWWKTEAETLQTSGAFHWRSRVDLYEADCRQGRLRNLFVAGYTGSGMTGESITDSGASDWMFAVPGTLGETIIVAACQGVRAAQVLNSGGPVAEEGIDNTAAPAPVPPVPVPLWGPQPPPSPPPPCTGAACYGQPSAANGRPRTDYVQGYTRRDGTYVQGYYRSKPRRR